MALDLAAVRLALPAWATATTIIAIQNNNIAAVQFGVVSQGNSSANKNLGTVITGNTLGGAGAFALGRAGIFVGFDDGVQITNNNVSQR